MIPMKTDQHIHTPYCPHGSADPFERYIEQAIKQGFRVISFTEHAPLPPSFIDPTPDQDSGMKLEHLEGYIHTIQQLKASFKQDIRINVGFEVDFIEGFEEETKTFLDTYGPEIDDSILSVHFLKNNQTYYCMDYSSDVFSEMINVFGGVENVYKAYYDTVYKSILSSLGAHKPKRIGHMTLVHKFQKAFPCQKEFSYETNRILDLIQEQKMQLDYNGAGLYKPLCEEPYPTDAVVKEAKKRNIPLIYGSDAHTAKDVGQGYSRLEPML